MKKLIIMRHGDYNNYDYRLSKYGKKQMVQTAKIIHSVSNEYSIFILTSTAPRAIDSAKAINEVLQVGYEEHDELWDDDSHQGDWKKSINIIDSKKDSFDMVIVVTHLEFTEILPYYFAREVLEIDDFDCGPVGKGEAIAIDFENLSIVYIPYL